MECKKIKFNTQDLAIEELRRITESNDYRTWKQKTPCRAYLCFCGAYHLTSQPKITI